MKITWYVLAGLVVAAFLVAVPVHAASVAISDDELAGISGKNNVSSPSAAVGPSSSIQGDSSAIIQLATYSWSDNHTTDGSTNKGANNVSGATSVVQQDVVASSSNAITWGAWATGVETLGAVTGDLGGTAMSYAAQHVGGF